MKIYHPSPCPLPRYPAAQAGERVHLNLPLAIILLALLAPGCAQRVEEDGEAAFRARFKQGSELLKFAHEQSDVDAPSERSLLVDAREEFLRAALLRPGHIETALRITTITRRLGELAAVIEQQQAEDNRRREKLADTIRRLEKLTARQEHLSQQSQAVLRRPPDLTGEQANAPEYYGNTEQLPPQEELNDLAPPVAKQQRAVRKETRSVLGSIKLQQETLRQLLTQAYGDIGRPHVTEIDPVVDLLVETVTAQDEALAGLARFNAQASRDRRIAQVTANR